MWLSKVSLWSNLSPNSFSQWVFFILIFYTYANGVACFDYEIALISMIVHPKTVNVIDTWRIYCHKKWNFV